jgi:CheY-like chemotaxis protein
VSSPLRQAPPADDPILAGRTVLVIEDHPDSIQFLMNVLQSLRARVITARTIEEAERQVLAHRLNLIVCDMRLPDGTGLDFIQWLRGHGRQSVNQTPCIAVTGWDRHFPPDRAQGFDAYMRKPLNVDRFCTTAVALARG